LGPELTVTGERELTNSAGLFGLIEMRTGQVEFTFPQIRDLTRDLCLIYGIGPTTAIKLKQQGYQSVYDLLQHPRWRRAAQDLIQRIETGDTVRLAAYGATDYQLLSFFQPETIRFIDIETLGLYYIHPVFLVGVLQFENGYGRICQYLARDFSEERAILLETAAILRNAAILVTYNGRSFDLPYLKGRMKFHQLTTDFDSWQLDLLHQARRNYRQVLPNCRLLTIEKCLLNQERNNDIPGAEIARYYDNFLDSGNGQYIRPILEHNAYDLFSMAKFLGILNAKKGEKVITDGD
jgi:Predicted exonuclease